MKIIGRLAFAIGLVAAFYARGAFAQPPAAAPVAIPGSWKEQSMDLEFMGFTDHYTCMGLQDRVERVLRALGARPGYSVGWLGDCDDRRPRSTRMPGVRMKFAVLVPAGSPGAAAPGAAGAPPLQPGAWRDVDLIGLDKLDPQECELAAQIVEEVVPRFTVRKVQKPNSCMPHQESTNRHLHVEVFAPLAQASQ